MNSNNGQGAVIQKNIQLQNFEMVDCLTAIKHGNGRDWWIVFRKFDPFGSNSKYYSYLISPVGISAVSIQNIGAQNSTNSGRISFNSNGNNMAYLNYKGFRII
ncbi:MAG: hypothetical protein IPP71_11590 [Bacteroidetes bacterium]|nr:hypothetical protein [Bacteroidota bacterium]